MTTPIIERKVAKKANALLSCCPALFFVVFFFGMLTVRRDWSF